MKEKKTEAQKERTSKIIWWVVYGVLAAATIVAFVFHKNIYGYKGVISGTDALGDPIYSVPPVESVFDKQVSNNVVVQWLYSQGLKGIINTVQIIIISVTLFLILKLFTKITIKQKRRQTIAKLTLNFVKWIIGLAAFFFFLDAWGANTTTIIASAGVLTLIIGLGSQTLVADILAGVFIVFESDFQVDDIVIIDGWRGTVVEIGIRTTKLVDAGGNVKIINNSEIKSIINQTKELSIAKAVLSIQYGARIEKVETIIADNLPKIKENIPAIVEGPFYKGVTDMSDSSVDLLFVAKCYEGDVYQVRRDLNRQLKIMADDNNISIPFPQITINYPEDNEDFSTVSKKEERKAEEFSQEQKELSAGIEIKEGVE